MISSLAVGFTKLRRTRTIQSNCGCFSKSNDFRGNQVLGTNKDRKRTIRICRNVSSCGYLEPGLFPSKHIIQQHQPKKYPENKAVVNSTLCFTKNKGTIFSNSSSILSRSYSSSDNSKGSLLHYEWINDDSHNHASEIIVFLHGLLGNGKNLRTLAKKYTERRNCPGLLLDLRGHGKSKSLITTTIDESSSSSNNDNKNATPMFDIFVNDIQCTIQEVIHLKMQQQQQTSTTQPKLILVGHSLGGRMALQYAAKEATLADETNTRPTISRVWLLDTIPGKPDDSVKRVIGAVTELSANHAAGTNVINDRKTLVSKLSKDYGLDIGISQWLASSLQISSKRKKNNDNAAVTTSNSISPLEFTFDLNIANSLLKDFSNQDFINLMKQVFVAKDNNNANANTNIQLDLVCGGNNKAWEERKVQHDIEKLKYFENTYSFKMHTLKDAGHWVHVDNLPGLLDIMEN